VTDDWYKVAKTGEVIDFLAFGGEGEEDICALSTVEVCQQDTWVRLEEGGGKGGSGCS
jgi:hypothetical protein